MSDIPQKISRVIAYIDGFNLYFGLKDKGFRRFYWLDVQKLVQNLLKSNQHLEFTKYFTSRISSTKNNQGKRKRHNNYLEALNTLNECEIFYGHYLLKKVVCRKCNFSWSTHEEKMTDVNIAVELMKDAFQDKFDTALIISGDSDLTGPIKAVRNLFDQKRIIVAFPPARHSKQLEIVANASFTIGRKKISDSQLPFTVLKPDGFQLIKPDLWR